jgi:hypothetical protein
MNLIDFTTNDFRPLIGAFILLMVTLSILREQQRLNREKELLDRMALHRSGSDQATGKPARRPGRGWPSRRPDQDSSAS